MIRELQERDIPVLKRIHRESGFDYQFPFENDKGEYQVPSDFELVMVRVDENDVPVQMYAARKTVEIYGIVDPDWRNPRWRMDALIDGHEVMRKKLQERGLTDAHCWLPPEVEKSFGRRLERVFGWIPSRWKSYSRTLKD